MIEQPTYGGRRRVIVGLWSHVQPIFFVPGLAVSFVGAILAPETTITTAAVHASAVALAVYVAHLTDGYVDYYVRGEDEHNLLSRGELRGATGVVSVAFGLCLLALWYASGPVAAGVTAPLLAVGYLHAPHLDANPVTTTVDYPAGIALATVGGYVTQTGSISLSVATIALVLFVLLSGIGILLDLVDYAHDRTIGKRTVPVAIGPKRAQSVSKWLVVTSSVLVLAAGTLGVFPSVAVVIGPVPVVVVIAWIHTDWSVEDAVSRLIGATYVFAALLVVSILLETSG